MPKASRTLGQISRAPLPALDTRYELVTELGRGAAGTVWEARDRTTSRIVAVKLLPPEILASAASQKRFHREVESAAALSHPHSVEVIGHGETAEGGGYLVMERLVGTTLAKCLLEQGPLPQPRAVKIAAEILDAVGAAHRLNIVHRDLKPSNVMLVDREGDPDFVKVCDFGLAKAIDPHEIGDEDGEAFVSATTQQGEICGTPEYMAPEQARGDAIDGRADLYSVAVILFHAIVGRAPFSGRTMLAVISQHLSRMPPRPSELRPDLDIFPPLENLILRGLAKDPADRPSSADVFRADLLQIARDYRRRVRSTSRSKSLHSSSPGDTLPTASEARRRPTWRGFRGAVALTSAGLVLGGVLLALWRRGSFGDSAPTSRAPQTQQSLVATTTPAYVDKTPSLESEPDAKPPRSVDVAPVAAERIERPRVEMKPPKPRPTSVPPATPTSDTKEEARGLLARGEDQLSSGRVAEACALGDAAAARTPENAAVFEFLGRCYMRLGEPRRARAHYRTFLSLAPSDPRAVFIRAIVEAERP